MEVTLERWSRFWVHHRKSFQSGNLTKNFVGGNKVIHQRPTFQGNRRSKLQRIQSPKPQIKCVLFDKPLRHGKLRISYRENLKPPQNDVLAKLPEKDSGVFGLNKAGAYLDREHLGHFHDG